LKRSFPEGFWTKYKLTGKADTLKGFLKVLDEEQVGTESISYRPHHPTEKEEKLARQYE